MTTTRHANDPFPDSPTSPDDAGTEHAGTPPDPSRAGAVWVTGTGAFLLFAAAAVFVAVQWNHLADEIKLGILATLTGACLLAGRRLRSELPATAGVVYHLGAFLVPVNIAAVLVHRQTEWPTFVLVQGAAAAAAWTVLNLTERSSVLRWSAAAAVVMTAGGVAAVTSAPAALVLAAAAVAAEAARRRGEAIAWAVVAGFAPALALAERALPFGTDVLGTLGLTGASPRLTAIASGAAAALVLGRNAHRGRDLVLVVLAALAAALGIVTAWVGLAPGRPFDIVGAATLFVVFEIVAHGVRNDAFWSRPGRVLAIAGETVVTVLTPLGLLIAAWVLAVDEPHLSWPELLAGALVASGWFIADLRRRRPDSSGMAISLLVGGGWTPATIGMTSALAIALTTGTASPTVVATGAVLVAAALVLGGRPLGHPVAAALAVAATAVVAREPAVCAAVAISGSLVVATAAVIRARMGDAATNAPLAWLTAAAAVVPLGEAHLVLRGHVDRLPLLAGTALAAWVIAAVLDRAGAAGARGDRGAPRTIAHLAAPARLAILATLFLAFDATLHDVAWIAGLVGALALVDALRLRQPEPLLALPIALPALVGASAYTSGLSVGQTGVALCVSAAIAAGIHLLLEGDWRWPALGVVGATAVSGFTLASTSLSTASTALLVLGGIGLAYSTVFATPEGFAFSGLFVTCGIWGHLASAEVHALDAYLAPVAVMLVIAGYRAGTTRVSSWVSFGPAIALLGGSALLERTQNGPGVHALVAGGVGVAAVLLGGSKRLIAPLLLGTGLLVALTAHESLGVTREVPTWGWLALGGTVLLLAGIAMERLDTGPVESGRRVVDMIGQRFT